MFSTSSQCETSLAFVQVHHLFNFSTNPEVAWADSAGCSRSGVIVFCTMVMLWCSVVAFGALWLLPASPIPPLPAPHCVPNAVRCPSPACLTVLLRSVREEPKGLSLKLL